MGDGHFLASKGRLERPSNKRLRFGFLLARNFTMSAFALFLDTLRLASDELDRSGRKYLDWDVLSDDSQLIKSSCGICVAPTVRIGNNRDYDYLVVVGGRLNIEEPLSPAQLWHLKREAAKGKRLIGLCTGSFILAEAGLLVNKFACVSWLHRSEFEERFPSITTISDKLYVQDGLITTCAGGTAVADLAVSIVQKNLGPTRATNAMQILQMERQRGGNDLQARNPVDQAMPQDPRVRRALLIMEQFLDQELEIENLAQALKITRRQLERLFKKQFGAGPRATFNRMRLEQGKLMLINTDDSISKIANNIGYDSKGHFVRQFQSLFGMSPSSMREQARKTVAIHEL